MAAAAGRVELRYPVQLNKLELSRNEIKDILSSKVRAIFGCGPIDELMMTAIKEVTQSLAIRTNQDESVDQRGSVANENYRLQSATPDQNTSPNKAASQNPTYVPDQKKALSDEQEMLFSLLIQDEAVDDTNLEILHGNLKRGGIKLKHIELCNVLDEATKCYLETNTPLNQSISSLRHDGEKIQKLNDYCLAVVTRRKAISETFDDNILDEKAYKKWAKHVEIIASFGTLLVSLKRLMPY